MKSNFRLTAVSFYVDLPKSCSKLTEYENILMAYGAMKSESYSEGSIRYRARIIQHFCNSPFLWTSKSVLSLNAQRNQLEYEVHYPVPVILFSILILGFLLCESFLWEPSGFVASFGTLAYLIRYVSLIYFLQKDVAKRLQAVGKENQYVKVVNFLS